MMSWLTPKQALTLVQLIAQVFTPKEGVMGVPLLMRPGRPHTLEEITRPTRSSTNTDLVFARCGILLHWSHLIHGLKVLGPWGDSAGSCLISFFLPWAPKEKTGRGFLAVNVMQVSGAERLIRPKAPVLAHFDSHDLPVDLNIQNSLNQL